MRTRRIDGAGRAVAENGAVEVGRWWRRWFNFFYGRAGAGEVSSVSTMFYVFSTGRVSYVFEKRFQSASKVSPKCCQSVISPRGQLICYT
jgi:hypothetical protein